MDGIRVILFTYSEKLDGNNITDLRTLTVIEYFAIRGKREMGV